MSFRRLSWSALVGLAGALDGGKTLGRSALLAFVPAEAVDGVAAEIAAMSTDGMAPRHIARALRLLAEERQAAQQAADRLQLVWSPPDLDHVDARDTAVVVQDLFRSAKTSVLISTFNLDTGAKATALFGALAARMDAEPALSVRLFANVSRKFQDETPSSILVRQFATRLRDEVWPGARLPQSYYDARSVEIAWQQRASLHAKAIVVDGRCTLLTSANFTQAAQERNIEAGILVDDRRFAERVTRQFDALVRSGVFRPCPLQ